MKTAKQSIHLPGNYVVRALRMRDCIAVTVRCDATNKNNGAAVVTFVPLPKKTPPASTPAPWMKRT